MADLRIAVLIDADNSSHSTIDAVLSQVATVGQANVRRAYGNWTKPELKGWTAKLSDLAIAPIQQFDLTHGKNASDIAMVIDAMDLLHAGDVDGFAIVSSDADFTPLVTRLRQSGAEVLGFGQAKAPSAFQNACSQYFLVESLDEAHGVDDDSDRPAQRWGSDQLADDTRLMGMLRTAIDDAGDDDGWAHLAQVSNLIRNQSSFQPRNYGYAKLSGLIEAIDAFETKRDDKVMLVRRKPTRKRSTRR